MTIMLQRADACARPPKSGSSNDFAAEKLSSLEGARPYPRAAKPYSDMR